MKRWQPLCLSFCLSHTHLKLELISLVRIRCILSRFLFSNSMFWINTMGFAWKLNPLWASCSYTSTKFFTVCCVTNERRLIARCTRFWSELIGHPRCGCVCVMRPRALALVFCYNKHVMPFATETPCRFDLFDFERLFFGI